MQPDRIPFRRPESAPIPPSIIPEQLLTQRQASALLAVSERTVYGLVRDGTLKVVRIGRAIRFDPADVRAAIESLKK